MDLGVVSRGYGLKLALVKDSSVAQDGSHQGLGGIVDEQLDLLEHQRHFPQLHLPSGIPFAAAQSFVEPPGINHARL